MSFELENLMEKIENSMNGKSENIQSNPNPWCSNQHEGRQPLSHGVYRSKLSSKQFKQGVRTIPGDDVHIVFYRCSVRLKITCLGPKIHGNVHSWGVPFSIYWKMSMSIIERRLKRCVCLSLWKTWTSCLSKNILFIYLYIV